MPPVAPVPQPEPAFNMSRNFDQKPTMQDSLNTKPVFGLEAFNKVDPVPVPVQPQRPQMAGGDSALLALIRRVGI